MADILVLQAARFGDLVQSKRLVLSLQREGRVHLLVDHNTAALAELLYPKAIIHAMQFHGEPGMSGHRRNASVLEELRQVNFARIYNCNFSGLTEAVCRMFDREKISGYRPGHCFMGGLDRSPWARLAFRLSGMRASTPLNLVDFWGCFAPNPISPELVNPVPEAGGEGIGVTVAGREARRSLPMPVLANILQTLFRICNGSKIKLFGTGSESPAARRLMCLLPPSMLSRTEDLTGKTAWKSLCAELLGLDLLVTPDTGIMHLAAHLGVPVMAFFLSSALCHETGPYGKGHTVWQSSLACSPCLEVKACPNSVACLNPFKDINFGRALAMERTGARAPRLPQDLQLWRTDLDDLGLICRLEAGEDGATAKRRALRSLLRSFLHLPQDAINPADLPRHDYVNLVKTLFPDPEWMLPPRRYC